MKINKGFSYKASYAPNWCPCFRRRLLVDAGTCHMCFIGHGLQSVHVLSFKNAKECLFMAF